VTTETPAMTRFPRRHRGFSLVELMVAVVAGLIVSGAIVTFMMSSFRSNAQYVQSTRLTQELRNTLDLVTRDLQRAGYDDDALAFLGNTNVSPFAPICITTAAAPTTCVAAATVGSCIIYAYDRTYPNGSTTEVGTKGAIDLSNGEVRGLRRVSATINGNTVGVVEYAVSTGTTEPACNGASPDYTAYPPVCNATSTWCPLSDGSTLNVTQFDVTNNGSTLADDDLSMAVRKLDVAIAGQLVGDTTFTRDVRSSIKVRADCVRATTNFGTCTLTP
jgi:prepilin-type N-terminal cleavage/methylation domain-containing protein